MAFLWCVASQIAPGGVILRSEHRRTQSTLLEARSEHRRTQSTLLEARLAALDRRSQSSSTQGFDHASAPPPTPAMPPMSSPPPSLSSFMPVVPHTSSSRRSASTGPVPDCLSVHGRTDARSLSPPKYCYQLSKSDCEAYYTSAISDAIELCEIHSSGSRCVASGVFYCSPPPPPSTYSPTPPTLPPRPLLPPPPTPPCGADDIRGSRGECYLNPNSGSDAATVTLGPGGRLVYTSNALGDTVPDFSTVGYHSNEVPLPTAFDVPAIITLSAVGGTGDDTARIQAAIDNVSALPLNPAGFRGAVLLEAGEFRVNATLFIRASGVILRGSGDETVRAK